MAKAKEKLPVAPPALVVKDVFRNDKSGKVYFTAEFQIGATVQSVIFTLNTMTKVLQEHGYPINRANETLVQEMVAEQVPPDYSVPISYYSVGWDYYEGQLVFKGVDMIGEGIASSQYRGDLDLAPVG